MVRSRTRSSWRTRASRGPAARLALMLALVLLLILTILTGCTVHLLPQPTPTPVLYGGDEYLMPTVFYSPGGITAGPDGAVWFTGGQSIARITPTGTITTFPVPHPTFPFTRSYPWNITTGPDGALWFTDRGDIRIGRITPAGVLTGFVLDPPYAAFPEAITAGPDGALWFTRSTETPTRPGDAIGRITLTGTITQFALPTGADPEGITLGPDGALWFTEAGANRIGRITPTGSISTFPLPSGCCGPWRITTGPDGALWFTARGANRIGRITPSGSISTFRIPYADGSQPWGIVAGPDHALWFTESWGLILGRVTVSGDFTDLGVKNIRAGGEAPVQPYDPREIIVGPDGGLWFTNSAIHKIAHYLLAPPTPAPAAQAMATVQRAAVPRGALNQARCPRVTSQSGDRVGARTERKEGRTGPHAWRASYQQARDNT